MNAVLGKYRQMLWSQKVNPRAMRSVLKRMSKAVEQWSAGGRHGGLTVK
jgi:hypothetical protein